MNWHQRYCQQAAWTKPLRTYLMEKCEWAKARRVLEAGCGSGAVLKDCPLEGPQLYGLDLSRGRLEECRNNAPAAVLACGDVRSLPYPDQAFDITFCHFLLLWVSDPVRALQEMGRVTVRSGYVLALAEPDYSARVAAPAELAWLGKRQNGALRRQGASLRRGAELAELFRRAGIQLVESGQILPTGEQALSKSDWEAEWLVLQNDLGETLSESDLAKLEAIGEQARSLKVRTWYVPTYFAWGKV